MSINRALKEPSTKQPVKMRTEFGNKKGLNDSKLSQQEEKMAHLIRGNMTDASIFINCKTTGFLIDWLADSIDYYKELALFTDKTEALHEIRGIIRGQREILTMLEFIRKVRINKI